VFLFELRAIATRDHSANSEFDPVFVFFGLLFHGRSDGLLIARTTPSASRG